MIITILSETGNNGNERVLHTPQISKTGASQSDAHFVSYLGYVFHRFFMADIISVIEKGAFGSPSTMVANFNYFYYYQRVCLSYRKNMTHCR